MSRVPGPRRYLGEVSGREGDRSILSEFETDEGKVRQEQSKQEAER